MTIRQLISDSYYRRHTREGGYPVFKTIFYDFIKNGNLLFERSPGLLIAFYSLAFRIYVDTKKLRDAQTKAVNAFLEERGLS